MTQQNFALFFAFQSTPSVWRATCTKQEMQHASYISIHALRVEGDTEADGDYIYDGEFQSTPSVWRATFKEDYDAHPENISIHALRVEGDTVFLDRDKQMPRFQSTPSVWRATTRIRKII